MTVQTEFNWDALALTLARDGFVVIPGALDRDQLAVFRALADATPLTDKADYPESDKDVGYLSNDDPSVLSVMSHPPLLPLLERFVGERPVFINAWMRVALPHSPGAPWHQDLEREFWPTPINLAVYLDEVTEANGPTLVVPGTHTLPHPEFDTRPQPRERPVVGPAGTAALSFATVWHRGSANRTNRSRRAIFTYYRARHAIRIRRPPDPAPGQGWVLGDAGPPHPHWILREKP